MTSKIVESLDSEAASQRARAVKLRSRRVRAADGKIETVFVLDAHSPEFSDQFLKVFQLNTARARKATRRAREKIGVAAE